MIHYETRYWAIGFAFQSELWTGSILPKTLAIAFPATLLALLLNAGLGDLSEQTVARSNLKTAMATYSAALGTLLAFRINQAYSRYWEALTNIYQLRAKWFNVVSNSFAFCTSKEDKSDDVLRFQQTLMRLTSMLFCAALRQLDGACEMEIFDTDGFDDDSLHFLKNVNDKCEVILQWIQKMIFENTKSGIIEAPPPIASRIFQELGQGMFVLANVRKIKDFPFPYPYSQMTVVLLVVHIAMTILTFGYCLDRPFIIIAACFPAVFASTAMYYASMEIEKPFSETSDHGNHLPISEILQDFNTSLATLLDGRAQRPPKFRLTSNIFRDTTSVRLSAPDELQGPTVCGVHRFAVSGRPRSRTAAIVSNRLSARETELQRWSDFAGHSFPNALEALSSTSAERRSAMGATSSMSRGGMNASMRGSLKSSQQNEMSMVAKPSFSASASHQSQPPLATSSLTLPMLESSSSSQQSAERLASAHSATTPGLVSGIVDTNQEQTPSWPPLHLSNAEPASLKQPLFE